MAAEELDTEILTLLQEAFQLVGARVGLFLPSFHVKGLITRIGETLVTLEGVEVISNDSGEAIESPNQMSVKINDILSVSDAQEAEEPE
jgi:hypothetical protein